ncbi:chemotaxis protein CheW [Dyella mobilis]|uniref:Chemotaxis protein CheW n=1 Tax=Dyella mobilis TaxID=1849582 RepID=A0ABS2KEJ2_9GAMM|nr:chemotaxis protein CheW [Dyella mobilis]MBM7129596.1 chemotaxis protein CheW [Dyella mobilis]GLQ98140.1 chemotaxis protein W [Dyella mobilis]
MEHIASSAAQDTVELFGSFHLADTELALSVSDLQEVVNYPARVTQIPLAPSFLLGLFNLRGTLIPIVHLSELLNLPDGEDRDAAKIAIVEVGHSKVGLLFDATGEILRVRDEQKIRFVHADGTAPMIGGALKLEGGERILQILSPGVLVKLQDVPQLEASRTTSAASRHHAQSQRRQCVSFRVADRSLALPMGAIHEIIRLPELKKSVLASEHCAGLLNLRGNTVPVIDFARFLDLPATAPAAAATDEVDDERRILVIKDADVYFGLLVDEVQSIVGYRDDELLVMPSFDQSRPSLFAGCLHVSDEQSIILLQQEALIADEKVKELTAGHRSLYQIAGTGDKQTNARRSGGRETYVTFRLGRLMGMRIDQLREVIDFPGELTRPPGAPSFVCGILNLRQKLVTVVDLRALYGMPAQEDFSATKVMIVEHESEKYGLVVDAIENIVTIDVSSKMRVPSVLLNQIDNVLRNDMREVVELPDRHTLMLLDAEPLKARLTGQVSH